MKTMPHSKFPALVNRMMAKRKGWVKDSERPLIMGHIYKTFPEGKGK